MHTRAMDTLGLLAGHEAGKLIVVTHAGFMRALLVAMMTDGQPDPTLAVMLMRFLKPKNTGITEVHWNPEAGWRNPWRLVTLNETTHLTEAGDMDDNSAQALPV
jgi:broad specificity phosphatase PhoE